MNPAASTLVADIIDPTPNYDLIIKEDPIIQWRFKEVDTAIVAWDLLMFERGSEVKISYKVEGEFTQEDHVSSIIAKIIEKKVAIPTGDVVKEHLLA